MKRYEPDRFQKFIPKLNIRKAIIETRGTEKRFTLEVLFIGEYYTISRIHLVGVPEDWVIELICRDMQQKLRDKYGL